MDWSVKAATIPIFFGSGLAFLLAIEQLTRKKPNKANLLFSAIFLCCAIIIWGAAAVANGLPAVIPLSIYLFVTAIFFVGPLYYLYFTTLLHPEKTFGKKILLHFIPAFISFCIETGFQFFPLEFKQQWIAAILQDPPRHFVISAVFLGAIHAIAYLGYLLKVDIGMVWNVEEVKTELRLMVIINVLGILSIIALLIGFTFKSPVLFITGGNFLAVIAVSVFLGYNRYPDFLQTLEIEIKKKRYEKSSLTGVDIPEINSRLLDLLKIEKIYTDSDLNLRGLAEKLSLTPHQLSEFLNEHLKSDFRSFINSFRVEEAKKQLAEEPEKSVIDICFDVGFGSKSAFNSVFKKETGQTPSKFRDPALLRDT